MEVIDAAGHEFSDEVSALSSGLEVESADASQGGDNEEVGNGIALGCVMVRVFMRELARRLARFATETILTEGQSGFRIYSRCSNLWLVLMGVCE